MLILSCINLVKFNLILFNSLGNRISILFGTEVYDKWILSALSFQVLSIRTVLPYGPFISGISFLTTGAYLSVE